jgi:copper chaperone CopZ
MKSIKNILMAITLLLSITIANAQIKNAKTETVKIYGNCGMCETNIEKAGNLKKVAQVDWDKDTKMATLTYDSTKTSQDEILKRTALAGYDSEKFLAPDAAYKSLAGCCQYEREAKVSMTADSKTARENHENHANHAEMQKTDQVAENLLKPVFENYFLLKDALVKTDGKVASSLSKDLLTSLNGVKMDQLAMDVHLVWMKVTKDLTADSKIIAETQDIKKQRTVFMSLSKNMYDLMKIAKYETPVFYQFCPMANGGKGANWLSKDSAIKNPYYGSQMMSCGKTVETIK